MKLLVKTVGRYSADVTATMRVLSVLVTTLLCATATESAMTNTDVGNGFQNFVPPSNRGFQQDSDAKDGRFTDHRGASVTDKARREGRKRDQTTRQNEARAKKDAKNAKKRGDL